MTTPTATKPAEIVTTENRICAAGDNKEVRRRTIYTDVNGTRWTKVKGRFVQM